MHLRNDRKGVQTEIKIQCDRADNIFTCQPRTVSGARLLRGLVVFVLALAVLMHGASLSPYPAYASSDGLKVFVGESDTRVAKDSQLLSNAVTRLIDEMADQQLPACESIPFFEWPKFEDCRIDYLFGIERMVQRLMQERVERAEELRRRTWSWASTGPVAVCAQVPVVERDKFDNCGLNVDEEFAELSARRDDISRSIAALQERERALNALKLNLAPQPQVDQREAMLEIQLRLLENDQRLPLLQTLSEALQRGDPELFAYTAMRFAHLAANSELRRAPDLDEPVITEVPSTSQVIMIERDRHEQFRLVLHPTFGLAFVLADRLIDPRL